MLSSPTPLRRFERTHPYYLVDAINGSSPVYRWEEARSVSSRHLNRARSPQVVAHRDSPVLVAA